MAKPADTTRRIVVIGGRKAEYLGIVRTGLRKMMGRHPKGPRDFSQIGQGGMIIWSRAA